MPPQNHKRSTSSDPLLWVCFGSWSRAWLRLGLWSAHVVLVKIIPPPSGLSVGLREETCPPADCCTKKGQEKAKGKQKRTQQRRPCTSANGHQCLTSQAKQATHSTHSDPSTKRGHCSRCLLAWVFASSHQKWSLKRHCRSQTCTSAINPTKKSSKNFPKKQSLVSFLGFHLLSTLRRSSPLSASLSLRPRGGRCSRLTGLAGFSSVEWVQQATFGAFFREGYIFLLIATILDCFWCTWFGAGYM